MLRKLLFSTLFVALNLSFCFAADKTADANKEALQKLQDLRADVLTLAATQMQVVLSAEAAKGADYAAQNAKSAAAITRTLGATNTRCKKLATSGAWSERNKRQAGWWLRRVSRVV